MDQKVSLVHMNKLKRVKSALAMVQLLCTSGCFISKGVFVCKRMTNLSKKKKMFIFRFYNFYRFSYIVLLPWLYSHLSQLNFKNLLQRGLCAAVAAKLSWAFSLLCHRLEQGQAERWMAQNSHLKDLIKSHV